MVFSLSVACIKWNNNNQLKFKWDWKVVNDCRFGIEWMQKCVVQTRFLTCGCVHSSPFTIKPHFIHDISKKTWKKLNLKAIYWESIFFSVLNSFCVEGLRIILILWLFWNLKKSCCYRFDFPNCFITINNGSNQVNVY